MPNAPILQVPGDWNTQKPEFLWYEGTIWYKREFDYAKKPRPPPVPLVRRRQL